MIKIAITKGEEIINEITKFVKKNSIERASLSLIGAVDTCSISTMPKEDPKKDIYVEYNEPLELSGIGEIVNGEPHIHVTLGREDKSAIFGHLHWGKINTWFVHVYISPLDNKGK